MTQAFSFVGRFFTLIFSVSLLLLTGCSSTPVNTSASPEEVAQHFMDAQVEGGYAAAQAYVYPDHREDKFLIANWTPSTPITSYEDFVVDEPFMGTTSVIFSVYGEDWSAETYVSTAEIEGAWWVVSPSYIVE